MDFTEPLDEVSEVTTVVARGPGLWPPQGGGAARDPALHTCAQERALRPHCRPASS